MEDPHRKNNTVPYGSTRCKRLKRSAMAAELHALTADLDYAHVIRDILSKILISKVAIYAYLDRKAVFNVVAKDGRKTERRLKIDEHSIRK